MSVDVVALGSTTHREPEEGRAADDKPDGAGLQGEESGPTAADRDRALMARVADGDLDAYAALYDRWATDVYRLAARLLGSTAHAEDITQEVLLLAWRQADRYEPSRGSVRTWLLMLTHRRCVDRIRRERSTRERELTDARKGRAGHGVDVVAEEVERDLERQRVALALQRLTGLQREALHLAYYSGHTAREVAELLGAPLGTVKTRLRDGLLRLRRELGGAA